MIKIASQGVELGIPEMLVVRQPLRGCPHRRRIQFAAHDAAFLGTGDQSRSLQHGQMFHEAGQRHRVLLRQFRHRAAAAVQLGEDAAARAVGQRGKDQIELGVVMVNHLV